MLLWAGIVRRALGGDWRGARVACKATLSGFDSLPILQYLKHGARWAIVASPGYWASYDYPEKEHGVGISLGEFLALNGVRDPGAFTAKAVKLRIIWIYYNRSDGTAARQEMHHVMQLAGMLCADYDALMAEKVALSKTLGEMKRKLA